jgi:hypothetical protein
MQTISFLKHRRFDPELIDSMSAAGIRHEVGTARRWAATTSIGAALRMKLFRLAMPL